MLHDFLRANEAAILSSTEEKTLELALDHPSSARLKGGLRIFYEQMIEIIAARNDPSKPPEKDIKAIAAAADRVDEPAMAEAAGRPEEAELATSAGEHGAELFRLGYTLSHVVHAYGAMCQSITELASAKAAPIDASEFHALNRCLDVAIAGAVTTYQSLQSAGPAVLGEQDSSVIAKQMKAELHGLSVAFRSIQTGRVGVGGSTGQLLATGLERLGASIDKLIHPATATASLTSKA